MNKDLCVVQEGKVRRKLEKLLKGYEDVHFEAGFATGEGINAGWVFNFWLDYSYMYEGGSL